MHRGQPEVSLDVEASLRSRSPGVSLEGSLRSPGGQPAPCPSSVLVREGGERVFCVGAPYITRFLSGSFFLRPSPSTLPSMRCLLSPCFFQLSMFDMD